MQYASRSGVKIAYVEKGHGDPPVLLVHGFACSHQHLEPQFDHFSKRHRVVAMDLRGYGKSDKPQQAYSPEGHTDDLAWLCRTLDIERAILIGHSMGGVIAMAFAANHPELTVATIALDTILAVKPGQTDLRLVNLEKMRSPEYKEHLRRSNDQGFPSDDPKRKARALKDALAVPQHVLVSQIEGIGAYNPNLAATRVKAPFLYIDAGRSLTDGQYLKELCPHAVVGMTVGSGHWIQLEVPDQANAMIERFLAVSKVTPYGRAREER